MITSARINEDLRGVEGLDWISAFNEGRSAAETAGIPPAAPSFGGLLQGPPKQDAGSTGSMGNSTLL